jgi:hypothetical protein
VTREEITEFHFISPIENLDSILKVGILSHERARKVQHQSVAMDEVQARRSLVVIPGGMPLHHYANLYFHGRNPMLYKLQGRHQSLCVLRVKPDVLDLSGVVIADCNASSDYVRFGKPPDALDRIIKEQVFAEYWTHDDPIEQMRRKSIKCAEILVPGRVDSQYIFGAYVSCEQSKEAVLAVAPTIEVVVTPRFFFR